MVHSKVTKTFVHSRKYQFIISLLTFLTRHFSSRNVNDGMRSINNEIITRLPVNLDPAGVLDGALAAREPPLELAHVVVGEDGELDVEDAGVGLVVD